jgi:protein PhnA
MNNIDKDLQKRSNNICELCGSTTADIVFTVPSSPGNKPEHHLLICSTCSAEMEHIETADPIHWRCLNESIWSEVPAVKVVSWRMLHKLKHLDWARDILDIAYLDEETLAWAKASGDDIDPDDIIKHIDCFGSELHNGDNVVLTKTLNVKGATFNAPVGTIVRKIHLVAANAEEIEGKVNGATIVILTKYVKKSNA